MSSQLVAHLIASIDPSPLACRHSTVRPKLNLPVLCGVLTLFSACLYLRLRAIIKRVFSNPSTLSSTFHAFRPAVGGGSRPGKKENEKEKGEEEGKGSGGEVQAWHGEEEDSRCYEVYTPLAAIERMYSAIISTYDTGVLRELNRASSQCVTALLSATTFAQVCSSSLLRLPPLSPSSSSHLCLPTLPLFLSYVRTRPGASSSFFSTR